MKVFKNKHTKCITLCITTIVILASAGLCVNYAYKKMLYFRESTKINNSIIAEMMVQQRTCHLDSLPHNVLCIGNSITLHQPLGDINWYSCHGMAASKPEFDYCHILEKMMRQHNPKTTVTPVNLASWENDFSISIDSLLKDKCKGKDIIIIRIGENVQSNDVPKYADALSKLIEYCQQYTQHIVITGQYWPEHRKELAVVQNAQHYHLTYVPISWIWNLYQKECSPKEGDILYNMEGQPYKIVGNFITTHPNDNGMELIAKSIYNSL